MPRHQVRQMALAKSDSAISNLEIRLAEKRRVWKFHISKANMPLQQAFHWSLESRKSFVEYVTSKSYDIVLCLTESDVLISAECQPYDAVLLCDSDLLFYKSVHVVWRPMGSYKLLRFVSYEEKAILEILGLSSVQLVALSIISGNDYAANVPHLAINTNYRLVKTSKGRKIIAFISLPWPSILILILEQRLFYEKSIIRQYLAHPNVKRRTDNGAAWTEESYNNAFKVFVNMEKDFSTGRFCRKDLRRNAHDAEFSQCAEAKPMNPFATIDKPDPAMKHRHRLRYSPKIRYEPRIKQPALVVMMQYSLKPWKKPPEKPIAPQPTKAKPAAIKPEISEVNGFGRKEMMNALSFKHLTVTLDLDRLSTNVRATLDDELVCKAIVECIRGAVKVALVLDPQCLSQPSARKTRQSSTICVLLLDDDNNCFVKDGGDNGSNALFVKGILMLLYSGNHPSGKLGLAVNTFISRLQELNRLEKLNSTSADLLRNIKDYTPSFVVRSVASQMSAELRRHYKYGIQKLYISVEKMIEKGQLAASQAVNLESEEPTIQLFVKVNAVAVGFDAFHLSFVEHGYMTFTEIELAAFLHKRGELHPVLKKLIGHTDQQRRLIQEELTRDWLRFQTPGLLIQQFIAPVDPKASNATFRLVDPEEIRTHVNKLRSAEFDPRTYNEKGYFLRGSIKIDGTPADMERLLGCTPDKTDQVSYLGIDHGQARKKKRGSRGRRKRGSGKISPTISHTLTSSMEAATAESLSVSAIESSLPPLRGATACFTCHVEHCKANNKYLDKVYNGRNIWFKKYKKMSKEAWAKEFHRLADSLLRMARSLRYVVVGVNDYYSPKKCPTCEQVVAQPESILRLYCPNCRKYLRRDTMGGHNLVNILCAQVEKQERSLYLQPADKGGRYPWKEREDESASSPKVAAGPSQQAGSGGDGGKRKQKMAELARENLASESRPL
ncbi:hypothetical protein BGZ80_000457 [Entomortierella chlamydospora]|uniref:Uncharacterized protein n=1 Tax=Entomortierella chlamydospora TaxID=101097 RepID=A0A9P6MS63_9FUNG|nr:hypothetical protein BGZ80_000457 [Entomortierella chlamydospora]